MSLPERLKQELKEAMFAKNEWKKNILRVVLGEVERNQQGNRPVTDEQVVKIIRKIVQSNVETLNNTPEGERKQMLETENAILNELLPKQLTQDEIRAKLQTQSLPPGKAAMGVAMKFFKEQGEFVDGNDVKAVVESL